jgi:hypothetical protein
MSIKFKIDQSIDLSTFLVNGPVSYDEVHTAIKQFYQRTNPPPTKNILWDLRDASVSEIRYEDAQELAFFATSVDNRKDKELSILLIPTSCAFIMVVYTIYGLFTRLFFC